MRLPFVNPKHFTLDTIGYVTEFAKDNTK